MHPDGVRDQFPRGKVIAFGSARPFSPRESDSAKHRICFCQMKTCATCALRTSRTCGFIGKVRPLSKLTARKGGCNAVDPFQGILSVTRERIAILKALKILVVIAFCLSAYGCSGFDVSQPFFGDRPSAAPDVR